MISSAETFKFYTKLEDLGIKKRLMDSLKANGRRIIVLPSAYPTFNCIDGLEVQVSHGKTS